MLVKPIARQTDVSATPAPTVTASASPGVSATVTSQAPRQEPTDSGSTEGPSSDTGGSSDDGDDGAEESSSVPPSSDSPSSQSPSSEQPSSQPPSSQPPSSQPPSSQPPSSEPSSEPPSSQPPTTSTTPSTTPPSSTRSSVPSSTQERSTSETTATLTSTSTSAEDLINSSTTSGDSTSFTTFTTNINGVETTVTSPIPTSLSTSNSSNGNFNRTALIGGTTAAAVVLLLLAIGAIFVYKRAQKRRITFFEALKRGKREGKTAGDVGLLDDEFDDDDPPMTRYRDHVRSASAAGGSTMSHVSGAVPLQHASAAGSMANIPMTATTATPTTPAMSQSSPAPSLFRSRANDSGSIFHEGVWPPPSEDRSRFVDPLRQGSEIDLTAIVDDVMGPSAGGAGAAGQSGAPGAAAVAPLAAAASSERPKTPPNASGATTAARDRTWSEGAKSLLNDPFRDLSHSPKKMSGSVYYGETGTAPPTYQQSSPLSASTTASGLPPGAAMPRQPGSTSPLGGDIGQAM